MLVSISEFARTERAFPSEYAVRGAIRNVAGFPTVRIGRRIYIDMDRWAAFKASGGAALPGIWRLKPRDAA